MSEMKKVKVILSFGAFLIIGISVFAWIIKDKIPDNIFSFLDIGTYQIPPKYVEVNSSSIYGQSFVSNFDDLFMMSIFIPKQNAKEDAELYFHLKRNRDDNKDLVMLKWKFSQIHFLKNNFYVIPPDRETSEKGFHFHFQFPPIVDSKGKEFYFYFESPGARQGEGIKLGLWDNRDYYEALTSGRLYINHKPTKGFLAFRTYNTWNGTFSFLMDKIKMRLLNDRAFLVFYCISLLIIFSAVTTISIKTKNIRKE